MNALRPRLTGEVHLAQRAAQERAHAAVHGAHERVVVGGARGARGDVHVVRVRRHALARRDGARRGQVVHGPVAGAGGRVRHRSASHAPLTCTRHATPHAERAPAHVSPAPGASTDWPARPAKLPTLPGDAGRPCARPAASPRGARIATTAPSALLVFPVPSANIRKSPAPQVAPPGPSERRAHRSGAFHATSARSLVRMPHTSAAVGPSTRRRATGRKCPSSGSRGAIVRPCPASRCATEREDDARIVRRRDRTSGDGETIKGPLFSLALSLSRAPARSARGVITRPGGSYRFGPIDRRTVRRTVSLPRAPLTRSGRRLNRARSRGLVIAPAPAGRRPLTGSLKVVRSFACRSASIRRELHAPACHLRIGPRATSPARRRDGRRVHYGDVVTPGSSASFSPECLVY